MAGLVQTAGGSEQLRCLLIPPSASPLLFLLFTAATMNLSRVRSYHSLLWNPFQGFIAFKIGLFAMTFKAMCGLPCSPQSYSFFAPWPPAPRSPRHLCAVPDILQPPPASLTTRPKCPSSLSCHSYFFIELTSSGVPLLYLIYLSIIFVSHCGM